MDIENAALLSMQNGSAMKESSVAPPIPLWMLAVTCVSFIVVMLLMHNAPL